MIQDVAENWRLDRMAAIDRNICGWGPTRCSSALRSPPRSPSMRPSSWPSGTVPLSRAGSSTASSTGSSSSTPSPGRRRDQGENQPQSKAEDKAAENPDAEQPQRPAAGPNLNPSDDRPRTGLRRFLRRRHLGSRPVPIYTCTRPIPTVLCSPCEVVNAAAAAGLAALAITDHDTVSALAIARPEAARLGLELVAGAELTC